MPRREAQPIPPKNERGTDITKAQGQELTKNASARSIHSEKFPKLKRGGITANRTARITTTGV